MEKAMSTIGDARGGVSSRAAHGHCKTLGKP